MNRNAFYLAVFTVLCVLAGVLVGAGITRRAEPPWHGPPGFGFGPRGGPMEMFTAALGLSADQKTQVSQILEKTRRELNDVGKKVRFAITEIKEKSDNQIMEVLTPEQREKFSALKKKRQLRRLDFGPAREFGPPPGEDMPFPRGEDTLSPQGDGVPPSQETN
jgi:Spy/CpxP family protein refolding chaperone